MKNNKNTITQISNYCINKPGVYEARPFGKYPICYRVMGKIFAQLYPEEYVFKLTLKCEPEQADLYRQLYPGVVVRGYHCPPVQQPYWNTVDLHLFTIQDMLYQMIDEAYSVVTKKLSGKEKERLIKLSEWEYRDSDGRDSDFAMLCDKLGEQCNRSDYNADVIIVYRDDEPIACGSFGMYDEEHAELKRIFVDSTCEGTGLREEIIRRLEAKAQIKGYRWFISETTQE